jgi:hypothetical protein
MQPTELCRLVNDFRRSISMPPKEILRHTNCSDFVTRDVISMVMPPVVRQSVVSISRHPVFLSQ